jgi:hypothetical protein
MPLLKQHAVSTMAFLLNQLQRSAISYQQKTKADG